MANPRTESLVSLRLPQRASTRKLVYLMNDFTVQEHVCNLRCGYCLNFENELKGGKPWVPTEQIDLSPGGFGWSRAREVLAAMRLRADAPILRFSGGEVLAIAGSVSVIAESARSWHRVQVLTNATLLHGETLEQLSELENLNLCCSVDGHTVELNRHRVKQARWAQRILDGLLGSVRTGIPCEVNMVLSALNIGAICDFARYLADLPRSADLKLLPFPVRGRVAEGDEYTASAEQCGALRELIASYDELSSVLPPIGYLERLLRFYVDGRRMNACRVPLAYVQSFDDGVIASCANCWSNSLGNVLHDRQVFEGMGEVSIHRLFLRDPPRFPFCRGCFTPFDVANVYFSGDCTLEELARMDLYSSPPVRARLERLRAAWKDGDKRAQWENNEVTPC
jgi:MoaA/NifB/PqqE/SkfB family radical SAM enzyme